MFKTITLLVDSGCDINIQDKKGNTALHIATKVGSYEIIEYLFQHGGNINKKNQRGNTSIQIAASNGKLKIYKYFIKNGANVNTKNKKGLSLIHNISNSGGIELLEYFIGSYPDTNMHVLTNKKQTPLALVLKYKDYEKIISELLKHGITNKPDIFKNTEIHIAIKYASDRPIYIKKMISLEADVNIQNKTGDTALHLGVKTASLKIIKIMLKKYKDLNLYNDDGYNILHVACSSHRYSTQDVIDYLIGVLGANTLTREGNNILAIALCDNLEGVWQSMLEYHHDLILHKNNKGESILMYYLNNSMHDVDTIDTLIYHYGDIMYQTNNNGDTCLHVATNVGNTTSVNFFLKQGMDINVKNNEGFTPMHVAAKNGYKDFVKLLHERGGDVNSEDNKGRSVLCIAKINDCNSVVRYLQDIVKK
jgi:serine/threonine-protein phosphatase 6 regulatory ankyrin repeat subunit B